MLAHYDENRKVWIDCPSQVRIEGEIMCWCPRHTIFVPEWFDDLEDEV